EPRERERHPSEAATAVQNSRAWCQRQDAPERGRLLISAGACLAPYAEVFGVEEPLPPGTAAGHWRGVVLDHSSRERTSLRCSCSVSGALFPSSSKNSPSSVSSFFHSSESMWVASSTFSAGMSSPERSRSPALGTQPK